MDATRLTRLTQLISQELGVIFQRLSQNHFRGTLISVTKVRISPDLSVGRVYLSVFPSKQAQEILDSIKSNQGLIKRELGEVMRNQLRKMPDFSYFVDDSLDYEENIDKLLRGEGDNPIA
ncbi:MAG: 30S ribosome-binding factor RbfA [Cryomorphaceae bacterium]|nr:30S ribosome-binding factor RbfA [Cryomorphaceae bacterium]